MQKEACVVLNSGACHNLTGQLTIPSYYRIFQKCYELFPGAKKILHWGTGDGIAQIISHVVYEVHEKSFKSHGIEIIGTVATVAQYFIDQFKEAKVIVGDAIVEHKDAFSANPTGFDLSFNWESHANASRTELHRDFIIYLFKLITNRLLVSAKLSQQCFDSYELEEIVSNEWVLVATVATRGVVKGGTYNIYFWQKGDTGGGLNVQAEDAQPVSGEVEDAHTSDPKGTASPQGKPGKDVSGSEVAVSNNLAAASTLLDIKSQHVTPQSQPVTPNKKRSPVSSSTRASKRIKIKKESESQNSNDSQPQSRKRLSSQSPVASPNDDCRNSHCKKQATAAKNRATQLQSQKRALADRAKYAETQVTTMRKKMKEAATEATATVRLVTKGKTQVTSLQKKLEAANSKSTTTKSLTTLEGEVQLLITQKEDLGSDIADLDSQKTALKTLNDKVQRLKTRKKHLDSDIGELNSQKTALNPQR